MKKYTTHYRILVYEMSDPYDQRRRAFLPALKLKGREAPVEYSPKGKVFESEAKAIAFAREHWWRELGLPNPHIAYEFGVNVYED